jgi:hypothetical protein
MHVDEYVTYVRSAEANLSKGLNKIIAQHTFESDVVEMCQRFNHWSEQHVAALDSVAPGDSNIKPADLFTELFSDANAGSYGLLRDLHSLSVLMQDAHISWAILGQAAKATRNDALDKACKEADEHLTKEFLWVMTRAKSAAAQVLVVD